MGSRLHSPLGATAVICFGDGSIPQILIDCMQFRLVADRVATGEVDDAQLMQLQRHVDRRGCRDCLTYLAGRAAERRLRESRTA